MEKREEMSGRLSAQAHVLVCLCNKDIDACESGIRGNGWENMSRDAGIPPPERNKFIQDWHIANSQTTLSFVDCLYFENIFLVTIRCYLSKSCQSCSEG
jgi:hypothetical protein